MDIYKIKNRILPKALSAVLVCLFCTNTIVLANPDTLAPVVGNPEIYQEMRDMMEDRLAAHQDPIDEFIKQHANKAKGLSAVPYLEEEFMRCINVCGANNMLTRLKTTLTYAGGKIQVIFVKNEDKLPVFYGQRVWGHAGTYVTIFALENEKGSREGRRKIIARLFHEIRARSTRAKELFDENLKSENPATPEKISAFIASARERFETDNLQLQQQIEQDGYISSQSLSREFASLTFAIHPDVMNRDYMMAKERRSASEESKSGEMFLLLSLYEAWLKGKANYNELVYIARKCNYEGLLIQQYKEKPLRGNSEPLYKPPLCKASIYEIYWNGIKGNVIQHAGGEAVYLWRETAEGYEYFMFDWGPGVLNLRGDSREELETIFDAYTSYRAGAAGPDGKYHGGGDGMGLTFASSESYLMRIISVNGNKARVVDRRPGFHKAFAKDIASTQTNFPLPAKFHNASGFIVHGFVPFSRDFVGYFSRISKDNILGNVITTESKPLQRGSWQRLPASGLDGLKPGDGVTFVFYRTSTTTRIEEKEGIFKTMPSIHSGRDFYLTDGRIIDAGNVVEITTNRGGTRSLSEGGLDFLFIVREWGLAPGDRARFKEKKKVIVDERVEHRGIIQEIPLPENQGTFLLNDGTVIGYAQVKEFILHDKRITEIASSGDVVEPRRLTTQTDVSPISPSSGAISAVEMLPQEWHGNDLKGDEFLAELSHLLQIENVLDQDKSTFIFSEKVTFDSGLGVLLPKLVKSCVRVAVIATDDSQRALIGELNQGKPENEKIIYADTVGDIRTKVHSARYYYFKVRGDPDTDLQGITTFDITEIVKKIIDALGKISGIVERERIELLHEAARKFAEAA